MDPRIKGLVSIKHSYLDNKFRGINMCGFQNYGPFLGTLNIRCRIIIEIQKGAIVLPTII